MTAAMPGGGRLAIDHLVYAGLDLDAAVAGLREALGVTAARGGQHPNLGTHNALVSFGSGCYLEVIAPDPSLPAPPFGRPFGLDELTESRLAGWALRTTRIDDTVARARVEGFDPGDPVDAQRQAPTGELLEWRLTINALAGGSMPFLIDWGTTAHPSQGAPPELDLVDLRVEDPDPAALTAALRALGAEIEVVHATAPALVATIDGPRGRSELR